MPSVFPIFGAALPCLLLGAAHAATVPAAAPDAPVPPALYQPGLAYRAAPSAPATPDQAWKEQNRIVAATDSMALTMAGHGQSHAGHGAHQAAPAADPHAGHTPAQAKSEAHAGHHGAHAADPHAGHTPEQHAAHMAAQAQAAAHAAHAAHAAPAAPAAQGQGAHGQHHPAAHGGHAGHEAHQGHQGHQGHDAAAAGKAAGTRPAAGHQHEGHH